MDAINLTPTPNPVPTRETSESSPQRQSLEGFAGLDRARRSSPEFANMLTEAAAQLAPDPQLAASRINQQNLLSQTAAMNILAARSSAAMNPAIIGYASQIANQVNLEGNMPLHRPLRQSFGERFNERDRTDGHVRVPPINETQGGPAVL